jgi:Uma2 family endonuclease
MSDLQVRRWTRGEYGRMVDAGILGPRDRVELIEGEIVQITPQNEPHALVNLVDHKIEVRRDPSPDGYRSTIVLQAGQSMAPLARPGHPIAVSDLLP